MCGRLDSTAAVVSRPARAREADDVTRSRSALAAAAHSQPQSTHSRKADTGNQREEKGATLKPTPC